jgi:pimeloyl-ACP methyl ester carboxylesterase
MDARLSPERAETPSTARPMRFASRANPFAATAVSRADLSSKWRYAAFAETPTSRAASPRLKAPGPLASMSLTAEAVRASRELRRRVCGVPLTVASHAMMKRSVSVSGFHLDAVMAVPGRFSATLGQSDAPRDDVQPDAYADVVLEVLDALGLEQAFAARAPEAKLEVVPSCGHLAPLEAPEAVAAALDRLAGGQSG